MLRGHPGWGCNRIGAVGEGGGEPSSEGGGVEVVLLPLLLPLLLPSVSASASASASALLLLCSASALPPSALPHLPMVRYTGLRGLVMDVDVHNLLFSNIFPF